MNSLESFQVASFQGSSFLWDSNKQTGGNKNKVFEYPNKDTRFVQNLGALQSVYEMVGIIYDPTPNYINSRNDFIAALNDGRGILVHPIDGELDVFCMPYRIIEEKQNIGMIRFELTFYVVGDQDFPSNIVNDSSLLFSNLNLSISESEPDFNDYWDVDTGFSSNVLYSTDIIANDYDNFSSIYSQVDITSDQYKTYVNEVEKLNDDRGFYVLNSQEYYNQLLVIFELIGQLVDDNFTKLDLYLIFFNYSSGVLLPIDTFVLNNRFRCQTIHDQIFNSLALQYYYLILGVMEFQTDLEIDEQRYIIATQFDYVIDNNIFIDVDGYESDILNRDVIETIKNSNFSVLTALKDKLVTVDKIVNKKIARDSMFPVVYDLYSSVDSFDKIYDLNDIVYPFGIRGNLKIIEK